ncbi:alpha/beta fold hydrolase [Gordonia sp. ABSL11-1]|uniref:alpha/beta fold hydrolase n=1 Tax=Gordonia sp. ABSL11-1 TaxID=3053924 RepID=UPI00257334B3|nr:alpha/beta fold hydrolase [Gordonia sp. ABSL11-1]MDL9945127.1 alpha/beta fold hydrolase [Gordonia sp. ABSL11-1]
MTTPTIVLLHGVGLDHTMWDPVARLLDGEFDVVTPDLPGHGVHPPAAAGTTLADLADGVLPEIPSGSHLVGFSLGALVAQHIARFHPDAVSSVTSVSSVCRRTDDERAAVLARLHTAEQDIGAATDASLQRWYQGTDVPAELISQTRSVLESTDPTSFRNCYRVFATGDADIGPELGEIAVPALAITGENDPGSTPEMTHRLAHAIPGCREVVVAGARHMMPVERPREFVDHLTAFIGEHTYV